MTSEIQFIDDISALEPKKKPSLLLGPVTPQEIQQQNEPRPIADNYPPHEAFMGPLPPPPNAPIVSAMVNGPMMLPPPPNVTPIGLPYGTPVDTQKFLALNCIDIANHLTACPVCSKLHRSYAHVYIGIIVALIVLAFFLGRKFFE